jgi:uncharacterized protein
VIYLDTSAFVKLVWSEQGTPDLQAFLALKPGVLLVSSSLLTVEARRAVLGEDAAQMPRVDLLLTRVGQVGVTRAVLEAASRLPDPSVRPLDAIHVATALQLRPDLDALVTYDTRLASAAERQGLPVTVPGPRG